MRRKLLFCFLSLIICLDLNWGIGTRRRTLGDCPFLPDISDVERYVSELDLLANTVVFSLPGEKMRLTLETSLWNVVGSIFITPENRVIPFLSMAKLLGEKLRIGLGISLLMNSTTDFEVIGQDQLNVIDKKGSTSWGIKGGWSYLLSGKKQSKICSSVGINVRSRNYWQKQNKGEAPDLQIVEYQSLIEKMSLATRLVKKEKGLEVNYQWGDDTLVKRWQYSTDYNENVRYKLVYTKQSWEVAPGWIKQIAGNIMIIVNPGIGFKREKIVAAEGELWTFKPRHLRDPNDPDNPHNPNNMWNVMEEYFLKKNPDAPEPKYYNATDKNTVRDQMIITELYLPILRFGIEATFVKTLKIRMGIKSVYTFRTNEQRRIYPHAEGGPTWRYRYLTSQSSIGLGYTFRKFTIDINLNKMLFTNGIYFLNGIPTALSGDVCCTYRF